MRVQRGEERGKGKPNQLSNTAARGLANINDVFVIKAFVTLHALVKWYEGNLFKWISDNKLGVKRVWGDDDNLVRIRFVIVEVDSSPSFLIKVGL